MFGLPIKLLKVLVALQVQDVCSLFNILLRGKEILILMNMKTAYLSTYF